MSEVESAVLRLQAGERQALTPLYRAYAEPALRTAFLITRNKATAEDAVQEAFVQVLRSIGSLRDPGAFRSWFYRIVVNAAKRLARSPRRQPVPLEPLAAPSAEELLMGAEEVDALRRAMSTLSEEHREVIILRYYTELSEAEMAEVLGVAAGTVKSRLYRAREALQGELRRERHG